MADTADPAPEEKPGGFVLEDRPEDDEDRRRHFLPRPTRSRAFEGAFAPWRRFVREDGRLRA